VKDALKGYLALATGLTEVTRQRATSAAKALVAQGEATAGQVQSLADDLVAQSKSNREAVVALVKYEVDKGLGRVGLVSKDEVDELKARIKTLEGQLREASKTKAPAKAPARKAPAKKAAGA
jgi:polyhydroxyalkanoate synthesis regulator phasin